MLTTAMRGAFSEERASLSLPFPRPLIKPQLKKTSSLEPYRLEEDHPYLDQVIVLEPSFWHNGAPTKPKKRVRFQVDNDNDEPNNELLSLPAPLDRADVDPRSLWYTRRELHNFRKKIREICQAWRGTEQATWLAQKQVCTLAQNEKTRGLEQRACFERQRRKYLCTHSILREQQRLRQGIVFSRDPEHDLARFAERCTSWATDIAYKEAQRDFARAYLDDDQVWFGGYMETEPMLVEDDSTSLQLLHGPGLQNDHKRSWVHHDTRVEDYGPFPAPKRRSLSPVYNES